MRKFLFDLFPVAAFFIAYQVYDFMMATKVLMATMTLQVVYMLIRKQPIAKLQKISFALVIVLGAATIYLQNPDFMIWKPTVLYWLTAALFLGSQVLFKKSMIKAMFESQLSLPENIWVRLSFVWTVFFLFLGALNLTIGKLCSQDFWVSFKFFGTMIIMLLFFLAQGLYLSRYIKEAAEKLEQGPDA